MNAYILLFIFSFIHTVTYETYTLSLHDALPICAPRESTRSSRRPITTGPPWPCSSRTSSPVKDAGDRKSTRLNSSHVANSYAVFCLKKKKKINEERVVYDRKN